MVVLPAQGCSVRACFSFLKGGGGWKGVLVLPVYWRKLGARMACGRCDGLLQ
jgi:hypothetical protein